MSYSSNWRDLISSFGYGFVDDIEQYKHIVKVWAYTDMQPRTIGGLSNYRRDPANNTLLDNLFNKLAEALFNFVVVDPVKTESEFDEWHKNQCNEFVRGFNAITKNKEVDPIAYGKAQKIINVSFKYIYCLKDADKYLDKFTHCHMVLDRYTYSEGFYKNEVIPWCNSVSGSKGHRSTGFTSWSYLEYYEYITIQNNIRQFLNATVEYVDTAGAKLSPLQAEFYIFNKYNP